LEDLDTDEEDSNKLDLWEIVKWINLAERRDVWRADVVAAVNVWVV
jgi:hypothetical protein